MSKTYKKEGVFYIHSANKWVYRLRDNFNNLVSSKLYSKWGEANDEFLLNKR